MPSFRYRAVTGTGEAVEGQIDADSEAQVVARLRDQGQLPLGIEPAGSAPTAQAEPSLRRWLTQPLLGQRRMSTTQVAVMTRELATLLEAGLTLDQSLRLMVELNPDGPVPALLADLLEQVQGGSAFADALARHERVFSPAYVNMVRAGEAGGSLHEVMARLATFLDQAEVLREQVKSALVYPILVLAIAGVSMLVLLTVVLPQFTPLFENADAELPPLTQAVIVAGDFLQRYWWVLALALGAAVWLVRRLWRRPASRARIDAVLLRVPLWGTLLVKVETAHLARTLGTLLANGVPLLNALAIVEDTIGNARLRAAIAAAAEGVKEGRGLAESLAESRLFPRLAIHLVSVGERSGRLEPMLAKTAELFDREVRSTIERLMAMLGPALTIGLGLIIALIIGSILMAILSAYQLPL